MALATSAATLGDLQSLVSDLQNANAPVQLPDLKKPPRARRVGGGGWGMRAAVAGVLVVLGIAIGWGLYGNTTSPLSFTSDPGAKSDGIPAKVLTPPKQLQSLGGLNGLIEQMRQRFGDTMGYGWSSIRSTRRWTGPTPATTAAKLSYTYRGGWDDPSTSAKTTTTSWSTWPPSTSKTAVGILRGAPETLGMKPADVKSTYLIIDPSRRSDHSRRARRCESMCPATSAAAPSPSPATAPIKRIDYPSTLTSSQFAAFVTVDWRRIYRRDTIVRGVEPP